MSLWETGEIITKDKLNLKTLYIGAEPPTNPVDGMVWVDVSGATYLLKIYRSGSWDIARGADVDKITVPPTAGEYDYLNPKSADSSSPPELLQASWNTTTYLYNAAGGYLRVGERVYAGYVGGRTLKRVEFCLLRYGSPTGTVYFRVRRVDTDAIVAELGSMPTSNIPENPTWFAFSGDWVMPEGVDLRFTVEYSGGDSSNFIAVYQITSDVVGWGNYCQFPYTSQTWNEVSAYDTAIKLYFEDESLRAIDDNPDTYWQPHPPNQENAWLRLDLGSTLGGVMGCRVHWYSDANYRPQAYKIQASVDGSNWEDVVIASSQPPAGWVEYSWPLRYYTRYLRILITQHGPSGTRVNEFDYYQSSIWRHGHRGD